MTKKQKLRHQRLSKKAIRETLQDHQWEKTDKYADVTAAHEIYRHPDGRLLWIYHGSGRLYESAAEYDAFMQEIRERSQNEPSSTHVLYERFPYGEDFRQHIPQLIDELARLLKIPREQLDGQAESLRLVDAAIRKYTKKRALELPLFPTLVAYVTEVMRRETRGRIEMRFVPTPQPVWEPWVLDPWDRGCNPFIGVYDELAEQIPFSIYGSTVIRIESRRPIPDSDPAKIRGVPFVMINGVPFILPPDMPRPPDPE